jgi:hypothetical protein
MQVGYGRRLTFGLARHVIEDELREAVLYLRDEAALHTEGFPLAFVGIDATLQVEPAAAVLQVVNELVDGDVVFGGIVQVLSEEDDVGVFI